MSEAKLPTEELYKARIADLEKQVSDIRFERVDAIVREDALRAQVERLMTIVDQYYQGVCCCDDRYACDLCKEAEQVVIAVRASQKEAA